MLTVLKMLVLLGFALRSVLSRYPGGKPAEREPLPNLRAIHYPLFTIH